MKISLMILALSMLFTSCGNKNKGSLEQVSFNENRLEIGEKWSRQPLEVDNSLNQDSIQVKLQRAVNKIFIRRGTGTAFYIGQHQGHFIFATNNHVLSKDKECLRFGFINLFNGHKAVCEKIIGGWPEIDLTFFSIKTTKEIAETLEKIEPLVFEFDSAPSYGEQLITAGFGVYKNPDDIIKYTNNEFCKVVSNTDEFKKLPATFRMIEGDVDNLTWTFMHGCDGSKGDSGSPILSQSSGKVVGLYWGGKYPKGNRFKNPDYVRDIIEQKKSSLIWSHFNMGVPSVKIFQEITNYLHNRQDNSDETGLILKSILSI